MWPPVTHQFGGYVSEGHGIRIQVDVTADPRIFYYTVTLTSSIDAATPIMAETFLAASLAQHATADGMTPLVVLGEFHSDTRLVFAMGSTEAIGDPAAEQFQGMLPPGAAPMRSSADSKPWVMHLGALLEGLRRA